MLGLVLTLAVANAPAMPSGVTCAGWPASCDAAWGALPGDATDAAPNEAPRNDDGPRDYATPVEIDCPAPPTATVGAIATSECSDAPLNLWYRVSRFPDSERPTGSLAPAPRQARRAWNISCGGTQDVGHLSAPDVQPLALFALPGLIPAKARGFSIASTRVSSTRALAPPDRPPRV